MSGLIAVDPATPELYPPSVQAILKRQAPAAAHLGQRLRAIDAGAGIAELEYEAGPGHLNRFGAVHGGIVAAMLDDALAMAAALTAAWGEITPTVEMKVSYLAMAKPGTLHARAEVIRRGKTVMFLEARLADGAGTPLARASGTALVTAMKKD